MIIADTVQELSDILPSLAEYENAKNEFRNNTITQSGVNAKLEKLVVEINEFLTVLYSSSTDPSERDILKRIRPIA